MLERLKRLFPVKTECSDVRTDIPGETVPEGYFTPLPADVLVSTPFRKRCLKQLWENSSMPVDMYQRLCLDPVHQLLSVSQNLPATAEGHWGYTGGFGDLTLQFTTYAVRLARGRMFPPGATAEEQAAQ
ncbi:TPA: TraI domain-containing protein, partial [Escherichia coli]